MIQETEKQAEKKWWDKYNSFCLNCQKSCKQSSKITIMYCPKRIKIKEEA